jgi:hypothetical protein
MFAATGSKTIKQALPTMNKEKQPLWMAPIKIEFRALASV